MLNYDELYDELEKSQNLLVKMIKQLNMKSDLSPQEVCNLKEAVDVMEKIIKLDGMIEDADNEDGYSERYMDDRRDSMARGRSPRTGRYVSRRDGNYMRGMSHHSIEDRMVAALEDQMDNAGSDYERKMVGDWINRIRTEQK